LWIFHIIQVFFPFHYKFHLWSCLFSHSWYSVITGTSVFHKTLRCGHH
jgi:hypothetical protein